jgi:beta-aspartyl-peptidase (threonine type)
MSRPALIVHGGAGRRPPDLSAAQRAGCLAAVEAGWQILRCDGASGGAAIDAVCAAVVSLENDPAFNAGRGSCLTSAGTVEMDASVMDGRTLRAGAVAVVRGVLNPVRLARAIMEDGRHLMFAGSEAEAFARRFGIETCPPQTLVTERQWQLWQQRADGVGSQGAGTVGAVAVDSDGHVAAATSTGGVFCKLPGRVGDSALIGAGTYADDAVGAASATGLGEAIIRLVLACRVVDALRDGGDPAAAARAGISQLAQRVGATGGIIVIDPRGRIGYAANTPHMTVGYMCADLCAPVIPAELDAPPLM